MTIKDVLTNVLRKNNRVKEIVEERRAQKLAEQRDKNSNERELERFFEEERQKRIKLQLEGFRKQRMKENWKSNLMKNKYMFKDEKPILKEKNIFKGNKSSMLNNGMGGYWK